MPRPQSTAGLRHVALNVRNWEACLHFYQALLGMQIEWQPDPDNVYLTSGNDNLALHRALDQREARGQALDHIGFIVASPEDVDLWYDYLVEQNVPIKKAPRTHRDGARSFYCTDPDTNVVQIIFHPPISGRS